MKRAIIFGIYAAITVADAAIAQQPIPSALQYAAQPSALLSQIKTFETPVPMPGWQPVALLGAAGPIAAPPDLIPPTIVIKYGQGGRVLDHRMTFEGYRRRAAKVEIRGPCYSACTLLLGYLERKNLCIAPGAFMAFHSVRGEKLQDYKPGPTHEMYESYPPEVRNWIDHNGGWQNLPIDGYWTMYDRELWAMGYPKCN